MTLFVILFFGFMVWAETTGPFSNLNNFLNDKQKEALVEYTVNPTVKNFEKAMGLNTNPDPDPVSIADDVKEYMLTWILQQDSRISFEESLILERYLNPEIQSHIIKTLWTGYSEVFLCEEDSLPKILPNVLGKILLREARAKNKKISDVLCEEVIPELISIRGAPDETDPRSAAYYEHLKNSPGEIVTEIIQKQKYLKESLLPVVDVLRAEMTRDNPSCDLGDTYGRVDLRDLLYVGAPEIYKLILSKDATPASVKIEVDDYKNFRLANSCSKQKIGDLIRQAFLQDKNQNPWLAPIMYHDSNCSFDALIIKNPKKNSVTGVFKSNYGIPAAVRTDIYFSSLNDLLKKLKII